jgi:hypothetical protein
VLARSWDEWVEWNRWRGTRDDFNRQFIFSLARARNDPSHWLFGGVFEVLARSSTPHTSSYDVALRSDLMGVFIKRLMVGFRPPGRAVRLNMEAHLDGIDVASILEQPYAGEPFPGHVNHTLGELEVAIKQDWPDWRGALQHMGRHLASGPHRPCHSLLERAEPGGPAFDASQCVRARHCGGTIGDGMAIPFQRCRSPRRSPPR